MSKELTILILDRIRELCREAKEVYHEVNKWRENSLNDIEKTTLRCKGDAKLDEAVSWLNELSTDTKF